MSVTSIVVVSLVAMAALAWLAWRQRRSLRWPGDAECLEIMRQEGVDLSKPRRIEFHLHFPSREAALEAERAVAAAGFASQVGGGPGLPDAILCASKVLMPNKAEFRNVRKQLGAVARQHGGSYKGCFPRGGGEA